MVRNRFERRTLPEVVSELVTNRTAPGDGVCLHITYNGEQRPTMVMEFRTTDSELRKLPTTEDITDFLPDHPWVESAVPSGRDPETGEEITFMDRSGYETWREFINHGNGLGVALKSIVQVGGRNFSFVEETTA